MNSKLEEYLLKAKSLQTEKQDKHLLELCLYEKVYSPDGLDTKNYNMSEYNLEEQRTKYFKTVPIKVTDEEYSQILEAEKINESQNQSNSNGVATALTVIAVLTYIVGFILGLVLGNQLEFSFIVIWWGAALVSGTMVLGFAEIIKLLDKISNK
ncbi:MAG: hypothetical protein CVU91_10485 [Firmicutes bacterium HGW-Firmicutes-16]|nr:MAG: hypothetical protein CVU91_10485 [Firmicutes bacterium HGW-Firmicutes-16]